ncbi:MAG: ATP-binding protein, partial [Pseudomonadota bacterium]
VSFANEHFLKKMGKKRDAVIGKSLETALGKGYHNLDLDEKILKVIKFEEVIKGQFELKTKYYDYQIVRFKERIGRRFNAMLIMEDVTERMHLEEQLRHSDRMSAVGRFTASVAHEINNPLSIVVGNVQYLIANLGQFALIDKKQAKELSETLETVEEQASRCGEIVANLLHFSHKGKVEREEMSVTKIINRAVKMLEHQLRMAKVETVMRLAARLPVIVGDANLLQQVFMNLMLNSQHAMNKGGKLYIRTFTENSNWICVSFRDTGPGIPKKHLRRIFEPFYSTRKAGEGTGLGLSVVHSIVESHDGIVDVKSKKGVGATFTVKLPISKKR